jgi:two-component system phosphate regulon sensor histidine kinase PhoR
LKKRIRWKLLGSYLMVVLLCTGVLGLYLTFALKSFFVTQIEQHLFSEANLLLSYLPDLSANPPLDELARALKHRVKVRITILNSEGKVLGDSDQISSSMENHLFRPEIQEALQKGKGKAIQFSPTLHQNLLYVALPIQKPDQTLEASETSEASKLLGFLRLALPLTEVEHNLREIRNKIILGSLIATLLAAVLGISLARSLESKILSIIAFTQRIARGELEDRMKVTSQDELGTLIQNLNQMAEKLGEELKAVSEEKKEKEAILASLTDGVLVIDKQGKVILSNPVMEKFFGLDASKLLEVLQSQTIQNLIQEVQEKKSKVSDEIQILFPRKIDLAVEAVPIKEEQGGREGTILVFRDVTRIKRLEQMRVDFVANVSHELRTPLTAIKGFVETLLDGAIEDKDHAVRFLKIVANHSDRLSRLLDDLLTLSNIELGKIKIERSAVSVEQVVQSVLLILQQKALDKGIQLTFEASKDLPPVLADRDRLIQILVNLVDNGIKYTERGGKVSIEARIKEEQPHRMEIAIKDTGIGIPESALPRLGERFYRVDKARSRAEGGTGLGLAIVKHLVEVHEGSMRIESQVGKGTTVRLMFPTVT